MRPLLITYELAQRTNPIF